MGKGPGFIRPLRGNIVGVTKPIIPMETKLQRITTLSKQNHGKEYKWLMAHFTKENLIWCFNQLDGKKAVGIDGQTKDEYGNDLETNVERLIGEMKAMAYRPSPVRQVLIPKSNGGNRPLGISNIEDKIIQMMFSKILESIYEPIFSNCSYGFRRNRSAHEAIREMIGLLRFNNVKRVIDVDIENFYGTIDHKILMNMLSVKIKDKIFLRYIARMLKSGIMTGESIIRDIKGLPQGSILSPVLSNIYGHYVIDLWFDKVVPKHIIGKAMIIRYCDDLVVMCTDTRDIEKINNSFNKRLAKFGLKLNLAKSKVVKFNRWYNEEGEKQETFDFLGFTIFLSKARNKGFTTVKVKTSKKTMKNKLKAVSEWCKLNRFTGSIRDIWLTFCRKLRGHIAYFGVTDNGEMVTKFMQRCRKVFFKWMNRRSQKRSINWQQFTTFEKQYPMPMVKIHHSIYKSI